VNNSPDSLQVDGLASHVSSDRLDQTLNYF